AIFYFSNVVRARPKSVQGWEALVRCLYLNKFYEEALEQVLAALQHTEGKPVFIYYKSAILFALGKSKEGLLYLERGLQKAPRQLKEFVALNPTILQNQLVVDLIARHRKTGKA
ncbi:hypothetical protein MD537_18505, partial [Flavihumibacter sediminis]|nr:hypothetical protein [Flavihumibacter sediminis]